MKCNRDYYLKWNRKRLSQKQFKIVWNFINIKFFKWKTKSEKRAKLTNFKIYRN